VSTGAIAGIGTDLLRVVRIEPIYARHGERLLRRILGADELLVHRRRQARDPGRGVRYLATRFPPKDAFCQAIGLGIRMSTICSRVQVLNRPGGATEIRVYGPLADWYATRFGRAHVSMTDEADMVAAFVVIEPLPAVADSKESIA